MPQSELIGTMRSALDALDVGRLDVARSVLGELMRRLTAAQTDEDGS